jgi:hypothetical protein
MDRSIPLGGRWSIGLDPILGLIPGFGDFASAALSSVIVVQGYRAGISKATLLRMVANVGIDVTLGAIPLIGDAFDFVFRANTRNLQLYREAIAGARDSRKDVRFLLVLLAMLGLLAAIPVMLVIWAIQYTF